MAKRKDISTKRLTKKARILGLNATYVLPGFLNHWFGMYCRNDERKVFALIHLVQKFCLKNFVSTLSEWCPNGYSTHDIENIRPYADSGSVYVQNAASWLPSGARPTAKWKRCLMSVLCQAVKQATSKQSPTIHLNSTCKWHPKARLLKLQKIWND